MEQISVFDIIKIGIGPSSSHTMGPWRAALRSLTDLDSGENCLENVVGLTVDLFGSLAKTGRGHGTDFAIVLGLLGEDPETADVSTIQDKFRAVTGCGEISLSGQHCISFLLDTNLRFNYQEVLPFHPNGMRFTYVFDDGSESTLTYYSIGGGFVVRENEPTTQNVHRLPYPIQKAEDLIQYCHEHNQTISEIVLENERSWRTDIEIEQKLEFIWNSMRECIYLGVLTEGELPGGLGVKRRAAELNQKLFGTIKSRDSVEWLAKVASLPANFQEILKWVTCFAIATNEQNASFGRVVTVPTNGASGVVPAVLCYMVCFTDHKQRDEIHRFLLVAGELGSLFKKGATISAAMGGCQAEIGVSSAMAAAALTECLGGSPEQAVMAAEIAMEHHLGLTCDPVGGLVQIPCIERNSMGAVKAITAAHIAMESNPSAARVSLDSVIKSMWETALDMNGKYKETSEGGLAANISINVVEC